MVEPQENLMDAKNPFTKLICVVQSSYQNIGSTARKFALPRLLKRFKKAAVNQIYPIPNMGKKKNRISCTHLLRVRWHFYIHISSLGHFFSYHAIARDLQLPVMVTFDSSNT